MLVISRHASEVSIPHRYGKNNKYLSMNISLKEVSIPHRYGKNDGYIPEEDAVVEVFPFLIGTVRTLGACCGTVCI